MRELRYESVSCRYSKLSNMTTTHLYRGNAAGEILDADGTVAGRIVPVEPTPEMANAPSTVIQSYGAKLIYQRMLSAAPADWSEHAVRVPERQPPTKHKDTQLDAAIHGWNSCLDAIKGAK